MDDVEESLRSRGTFETLLKFDKKPNSRMLIPAKFHRLVHSRKFAFFQLAKVSSLEGNKDRFRNVRASVAF